MDRPKQVVLDEIPGLAKLVVKDGVALGGLGDAERDLALGFVWAGLPREPLTERQVNDALKTQLCNAARCLGTDHVELRRWLCDGGWLARDGFGREYRRVAPPALPGRLQALGVAFGAAFASGDTGAYAEAQRAARAAEREARRRAHEAKPSSATTHRSA